MSPFKQKTITLLVPLVLALAWAGGEARKKDEMIQKLGHISEDITGLVRIDEDLYRGYLGENPREIVHIAHAARPSYGGPLKTALVVDSRKTIRHVAVLDSADTRSYLEKVVDLGILDHFTGKSIDKMPHVDIVSGATISSTAVIQGLESAAWRINSSIFGMPGKTEEYRAQTPETIKLVMICLFFAAALGITHKKFKPKRRARAVLLGASVIILGFWLGAQFSLSTVVSLLSGAWLKGMATYAALLCLVLAAAVFIVTKKNLFCSMICPYGAVQEGLGNITGCSPPKKSPWMDWVARAWVFSVLAAALYFQAPADAMYEPFSKAFNFVGSGTVYGLTILIVVASLVLKRPWCALFCPMGSLFYYLRFARNSFSRKTQDRPARGEKKSKDPLPGMKKESMV